MTLGALLLVPWPAAPAPGTALMTEDIPVLGDRSFGPAVTARGYEIAGRMGVRMLRLHTGRDATFTWEARVDPFVHDTVARGFAPYLTLTYRRRYRDGPDPGYLGVPAPETFAAWCGEAALRYRGLVHHYGVFNEPNYFGDGLTPRAYNALFEACAAAIAAVDPAAAVYYGEMAAGEDAPDPCRWVARSLSPTQPTVADGLAIHTYQWTDPPELPTAEPCSGIGRLADWTTATAEWAGSNRLRDRDGGPLPLLITEHGYCSPHGECPPSDDGSGANSRLDEATRADWARRAFLWARAHGVAVFSWYHLFNQPPGDPLWDSGIVGLDGRPAPAAWGLREAAVSLGEP